VGELRVLAVVPARLGSTRLPRKMLLRESGAYLFEHAARSAAAAPSVDRVVVATDSDEVRDAARSAGLEALMTSVDHQSGTDRVEEVVRALAADGDAGWDVVVNVQGDEAELPTEQVEALVSAFADPDVELATLAAPLADEAELASPDVVKVVADTRGDALYFSRAPVGGHDADGRPCARHHVGVYAFRPAALSRFCSLPHGALERAERLEQLRWLEAGGRIRLVPAAHAAGGIDTEAEYRAFVQRTLDRTSPQIAPQPRKA
jgi:3-deoxy-manno-octulosonate cytidylyltransferase (CMP-KDO synthetase)